MSQLSKHVGLPRKQPTELLPGVNVPPASQSTINPPSLTMRLKKTISSTGLMLPSLTGNQTASRDGSRKPCTSVRKASVQSTDMRAASPSARATTAFLTRSFRNVSRTGSSEYQLHLMKVSDRDRNVNKKLVLVVFLVKFIIKRWSSVFVLPRHHSKPHIAALPVTGLDCKSRAYSSKGCTYSVPVPYWRRVPQRCLNDAVLGTINRPIDS